MVKIIKKVTLNAPASTSTGVDPTKGTEENPYTKEEYDELCRLGLWTHGWFVEGIGIVLPDVVITSSYPYYPIEDEDDDWNNDDDWYDDGINPHPNPNPDETGGNGGNYPPGGGGGGGGNGTGGGNDGNNSNSDYPKGWCIYNCITFALNKFYSQKLNKDYFTREIAIAYRDGLQTGVEPKWPGTHNENDYDYGPRLFDENNKIINSIKLFLEYLFYTSEWVFDKNAIKEMVRTADQDSIVIGLLSEKNNKGVIVSAHAGILEYKSNSKCVFVEADNTNIKKDYLYSEIECTIKLTHFPYANQ
jgi:hypothetical protein